MRIGKQFLFAKPKKVRTRNNPQNYKPAKTQCHKAFSLSNKISAYGFGNLYNDSCDMQQNFLILLGHFSTA